MYKIWRVQNLANLANFDKIRQIKSTPNLRYILAIAKLNPRQIKNKKKIIIIILFKEDRRGKNIFSYMRDFHL